MGCKLKINRPIDGTQHLERMERKQVVVFRWNESKVLESDSREEFISRIAHGEISPTIEEVAVFYADTFKEAFEMADEFMNIMKRK